MGSADFDTAGVSAPPPHTYAKQTHGRVPDANDMACSGHATIDVRITLHESTGRMFRLRSWGDGRSKKNAPAVPHFRFTETINPKHSVFDYGKTNVFYDNFSDARMATLVVKHGNFLFR